MATTYRECDREVRELLDELIAEHRDDLDESGARITLLFAEGEIKSRGQRVLGRCKVSSDLDKAEGKGDATIILDAECWGDMADRRRKALLHHELSHIAKWDGEVDADDRPKLKARFGDWENDGFDEVVRLYGADSPERRWLDSVEERLRQLDLPGTRPESPARRKGKAAPQATP